MRASSSNERVKSIKLRTRKGEMSQRFEFGDGSDDLHEWISNRIPPMPEGQMCEEHEEIVSKRNKEEDAHEPLSSLAKHNFFVWRVEGDHVCYSYLCESCYNSLNLDEGIDPETYPTTKEGYAVSPKHCS